MKLQALKTIIKEAVKEAIQEELKEIILEAVRAPKTPVTVVPTPVMEQVSVQTPQIPQTPTMTADAKRAAYENILGDTASAFTSNNAQTFQPQADMDVANGTLPPGEVDISQIAGLMSKK
tara:strand:- start:499 stop:858 length:360 start_codon:yes stop_codon:yes gene_type:complete